MSKEDLLALIRRKESQGQRARFYPLGQTLNPECYIEVLDVMGDERDIVQAARVSYAACSKPSTPEKDRALIRYLLRNRHTSPFEQVEIKFRIKLPIFVERQWARHRAASWNEVSARYTELPEETYNPERLCEQSTSNKQGSGQHVRDPGQMQAAYESGVRVAFSNYKYQLANGLAKEQARMVLPLSTLTEKIWKTDGNNFLKFLSLRQHPHAQYEIRMYANVMCGILSDWMPNVWDAYYDYDHRAMTFSALELPLLAKCVDLNALSSLAERVESKGEYQTIVEFIRRYRSEGVCEEGD